MFSDGNEKGVTNMLKEDVSYRCNSVLKWIQHKYLARGMTATVNLPEYLSVGLATNHVEALRTNNDIYCVLLKNLIGWKENFEGTLCCNRPLEFDQIINEIPNRSYISIEGFYPFEELYLRKDHGNGIYDVYFDLN